MKREMDTLITLKSTLEEECKKERNKNYELQVQLQKEMTKGGAIALDKTKLEQLIKDQKEEICRLTKLINEENEKSGKLRNEYENEHSEHLTLERKFHSEQECHKTSTELMKQKLESTLNEMRQLMQERDNLKVGISEALIKCKDHSILMEKIKLDYNKANEQIENLIASKQLLQKTMTSQLMSMKAQLEHANNEKMAVSSELNRMKDTSSELNEKYKTEQMKTKTLLDEIKRSKYGSKKS
jgi:hypothetical protein